MRSQQDFDQNKLEEEMRKRKERVEKWREEQRKKAIENIGEIKRELEEMKQGKKWSLEDDEGKGTHRPSILVSLVPCHNDGLPLQWQRKPPGRRGYTLRITH